MSKVAIVGVEGSGKTVLMGALCECYKQGAKDDPYLMPENKAASMFKERIPYLLRVKRQWPEATSVSSLRAMRWTLRMGDEVLEEIEMLDYPGELYRLAFEDDDEAGKEIEAHREALNVFLGHLTDADCLLVLLNIADIRNLGENSRNVETVWITRSIFDFAKKLPNIKRKLLVFTQADRYAAEIRAAGGVQGLYASKLTDLKTLNPDLKVIAMSAVSGMDGEGRPKEGYSTAGCLAIMREVLAERERKKRLDEEALMKRVYEEARKKLKEEKSDDRIGWIFIGVIVAFILGVLMVAMFCVYTTGKNIPRLTLSVEVDGKQVVANVSDGKQTFATPITFTLDADQNYEFNVFYKGGDHSQYQDEKLKFKADWKGHKNQKVVLERRKTDSAGR